MVFLKRVFIIGSKNFITFDQPAPLFSDSNASLPPYVTVQDAIGSLPEIENGGGEVEMECEIIQPSLYDRLMMKEIDFDEFYELSKRMGH